MTLHGPADPERFRTEYRRQRWYLDPLPACDLAPATDQKWPSMSAIKRGAWQKPFQKKLETGELVPLDAYRVANYAVDNLDAIGRLDKASAITLMATSAARDLNRAARRGTDVHKILEDIAAGKDIVGHLNPDADPYLPAARAFVEDCRPKWLLSEVVVFNRTLGYGGTLDAALLLERPDGRTYWVDYKTRTETNGCYEEDVCQLGGYSFGEYMIVEDNGIAVRRPLPALDGCLLVSISPTGYELYPIDLDGAREAFVKMHDTYVSKRTAQKAGRDAIGQPLHVAPAPIVDVADTTGPPPAVDPFKDSNPFAVFPQAPAASIRRVYMIGRAKAIIDAGHKDKLAGAWPAGVPTFKQKDDHDDQQLDAIGEACAAVEKKNGLPWPYDDDPSDMNLTVKGDDERITALAHKVAALPPDLVQQLSDSAAVANGGEKMPRLTGGRATLKQLAIVADLVTDLEAQASFRCAELENHLAVITAEDGAEAVLRAAGVDIPYKAVTGVQVKIAGELVDALQLEYLTVDEGVLRLTKTGTEALNGAAADKRELKALATPIAEARQLPAPRKYDDIVQTPALAAAVLMAA